MEDKAVDFCGLGCGNDDPTHGHLVRADIGGDMVNCPNPLNSLEHVGVIMQVSNEHIINTGHFERGNLINPVYQRPDSFTAFRKRLNDRPASFTSCTCDKDHVWCFRSNDFSRLVNSD